MYGLAKILTIYILAFSQLKCHETHFPTVVYIYFGFGSFDDKVDNIVVRSVKLKRASDNVYLKTSSQIQINAIIGKCT